MTMLIKIGNSQGVRIPKPLIKQAHLDHSELDFEVTEKGLLIKPIVKHSRENWSKNIEEVLTKHQDTQDKAYDIAMLDGSDLEDFQW